MAFLFSPKLLTLSNLLMLPPQQLLPINSKASLANRPPPPHAPSQVSTPTWAHLKNHSQPQDNVNDFSQPLTPDHVSASGFFPQAPPTCSLLQLTLCPLPKLKLKLKLKLRLTHSFTCKRQRKRDMLKEQTSGGGDGGGSNNWARVCDTCRSAACTVYCRADSAYLCTSCDVRIHAANRVASRHERVWVCESCERAPAAFLCKADAASLCTSCDADIHSANPLASRHHRIPIMPIPGCLYGPPAAEGKDTIDEAASWLLLNPGKNNNQNNGFLFGGEVDEYLDLVEYNSCAENQFADQYNQQQQHHQQQQQYCVPQKNYGGDSVVPVQPKEQLQHQQQNFHLGMDYESSKAAYSYSGSINHTVSVSSMDVVVPEPAISDMSISHPRPPKGTIDLFSGPPIQMPTQLTPMDREARVLRYMEKKKTRKFEKTIRYASRKAYAETRPRIKGRFAKRTDVEVEVDQMFSATMMAESGYGIVPSF